MKDVPLHGGSENGTATESREGTSLPVGGGEQGYGGGADAAGERPRGTRQPKGKRTTAGEGAGPQAANQRSVKDALSRLAGKSSQALDIVALHDAEAREKWPVLFEALNARRDVNGDDCDPGSFTVSARGGVLAIAFRSPAYNVRISCWSEGLSGVPEALEAALRAEDTHFVELKKHVSKKWREKNKKA